MAASNGHFGQVAHAPGSGVSLRPFRGAWAPCPRHGTRIAAGWPMGPVPGHGPFRPRRANRLAAALAQTGRRCFWRGSVQSVCIHHRCLRTLGLRIWPAALCRVTGQSDTACPNTPGWA